MTLDVRLADNDDLFATVTEEEIRYLWRSIKGVRISKDEPWEVVATYIALDMAFEKSKRDVGIEH